MIGIVVMGKQQVKLLKRRNAHIHRKYHLEKAKAIREHAECWKAMMIATARTMNLGDSTDDDIEETYINMLAEAISEENSKCTDDRRHNG